MAKKRPSLLNAFNAANPKRVEQPRAAGTDAQRPQSTFTTSPHATPQRTNPPRANEPRFEARADHAVPVRASSPLPMSPRRAGTHSDLPAPPPPFSRARLLLLSIVGASVLLAVVIALKFGGNKETNANVALANGPSGSAYGGVSTGAVPDSAAKSPSNSTKTPAATSGADAAKTGRATLDPAAGSTDEDKAFGDARNKFTIRLLQYNNDANGLRLARDIYRYLRGENVPVVQPIQSGDGQHIYVCADAKPKKDDVAVLRDYLKRMRGPDGKSYPFRDAYIDNIENVVSR
ncbi:MAG: hypothetical protein SGI72_03330 [Planctomycetota bacterium]|nr:hypothetical protein [Planctomycetota bacterium]